MGTKSRRIGVATLLAVGMVAVMASAETTDCEVIDSVPATIASPGIYCLRQTLTVYSSEPGITITGRGVLLDLNGHRLQAGTSKALVGIYVVDGIDVKIRNGTVRGFGTAVQFAVTNEKSGGVYNLIEDVRTQQSRDTGIRVEGRQNIIRRCVVEDSGLGDQNFAPGVGIHVLGVGHRVVDNDISTTKGSPNGDAILVEKASGVIVQNNRIFKAFRCGILVKEGANLVVGNLVTHAATCGLWLPKEDSKYSDNIVQGSATPYAGGVDAGNNR